MRFSAVVKRLPKANLWRERTLRDNYKKETFVSHASETNSGAVGWTPASTPTRPVRVPNFNGVNRVIPQLCRLVFRLCPSNAESAALRRVIDFDLEGFGQENQATVLYIRPEQGHNPTVSAEWLNGDIEVFHLDEMCEEDINELLKRLSHQSGKVEIENRTKPVSTQKPSIQGYYFPFNEQKNISKLPELNLVDAWEENINDRYYRDDEMWKLVQKPNVDGPARKIEPLGPYPATDDLPKYKY